MLSVDRQTLKENGWRWVGEEAGGAALKHLMRCQEEDELSKHTLMPEGRETKSVSCSQTPELEHISVNASLLSLLPSGIS